MVNERAGPGGGPERSQDGSEPPRDRRRDSRICVLVACFTGSRRAAEVRRHLGKAIRADGNTILDGVVLVVGATRKARIYDPRRTVAGALTSALTWGLFGLLVGGLQGLGIWGILGAICGGGYAYLTEHLLTKDELKLIGERLPAASSAIALFVQGTDPKRMLSSAASLQATTASIAAIASDLSAVVHTAGRQPAEFSETAGDVPSPDQAAGLRMVLARFKGGRGAWEVLGNSGTAKRSDPGEPQIEMLIQTDEKGRRRVIDPATGVAATSKSDIVSWGGFGLVYGAVVGFAGGGGVLGAVDRGLVVGVSWALFGLGAGALYGLWAGRAISARRLKRIGAFAGPDTSVVVAWAGQDTTDDTIERWTASASEFCVLGFNSIGLGVHLEV